MGEHSSIAPLLRQITEGSIEDVVHPPEYDRDRSSLMEHHSVMAVEVSTIMTMTL